MESEFFDDRDEKQIFAAAKLLKADLLIGDVLTQNQAAIVQNTVFELNHYLPDVLGMALSWQIRVTLLDMNSLTQAGRDFIRKLNTIKTLIKEKRWNDHTD